MCKNSFSPLTRFAVLAILASLGSAPVWAQSTLIPVGEPEPALEAPAMEAKAEADMTGFPAETPKIPPHPSLSTRAVVLYPAENPTQVNVAILSGAGTQDVANTLAVLIGDLRKKSLEKRMGLKVEVVNISRLDHPPRGRNVIYYRPPFLRAALMLAETVPGDQNVQPMGVDMLKRRGIDVEVWVAD